MAGRRVYVVDGARTPFLKAQGAPGPFAAADLAVVAGKALLARQSLDAQSIDEVILGCMMPSEHEANIARIVAVRLGLGDDTPGWSVQRNCGSGLQAIDCAFQAIQSGRSELVLAGGTEAMSRSPLLWQASLVRWFAQLQRQKSVPQKLKHLLKLKLKDLAPVIALKCGLTDPLIDLNMGQTVEKVADEFGISRQEMDAYAVQSHERLAKAQDLSALSEIVPLFHPNGQCITGDDGLRRDSSIDKLAKLKPYIEKPFGQVTAGNSSQITDGAALLLLASEDMVKRHDLPVLGSIVDIEWAACDPVYMGLGPTMAASQLLQRHYLHPSTIDYGEINEAFAGQVLACQNVFANPALSQRFLHTDAPGAIANDRLNVDGGSIALGHPVGATGARITLHLLHVLKRMGAKRGVASLCVGGGQGGAVPLESGGS